MSPYADVFGRLHPLVLHLPIGLIVGVVLLEIVTVWRRGLRRGGAPIFLLWLVAASAVIAAATGLRLEREDGYGSATLDLHRWLGIGVAVAAVLLATVRSAGGRRPGPLALHAYRFALVATFVLVLAAGHFGAAMTHGDNFLFAPLLATDTSAGRRPIASSTTAPSDESPLVSGSQPPLSEQGFSRVRPILATRCVSCHSSSRAKAGLVLDSHDALLRGSNLGPVVAREDPPASELLRRITLPPEDPDRMPPKGKQPLAPEEVAAIRAWIVGGSSDSGALAAATGERGDGQPSEIVNGPEPVPIAPPDPAALAALVATLGHVTPVSEGSPLLWVDLSTANPPLAEAQAIELLRPIGANIVELSLARCDVSDASAPLLAGMIRLRRLNLHGTRVADGTVTALAGHPALAELVLTRTAVTDACAESLLAMPALERVYLWGSACSAEGIARLRSARSDLVADAGELAESKALEVEPEPTLVKPTDAAAAPLAPVNATCPVSDKPVDARYLVLHEKRLIGFCCPDCPAKFWAEPARFAAKLEKPTAR